ncbi:hypothetical protein TFLX_06363 [Thermoflexales bacterium]|nr:hypothetical protein TFLX_06363 [Thermoflexales bacterium]
MTDQLHRLEPWMRGSFELIRHANGHLSEAGDTDRRLALIGFDNAIEVCIDVFIRLHPKLRDGFQISREEAERARQTFHSKIEFLDRYLAAASRPAPIPIEAIVWYHQLRNELYHSGNGMVPEIHAIEGSRDAAIQVFKALFGVDVSPMLEITSTRTAYPQASAFESTGNVEMEFLRVFIEFENALREFLRGYHDEQVESLRSVAELWRYYKQRDPTSEELDGLVKQAIETRNQIAHGQKVEIKPDSVISIVARLMELKASLEDRT